MTGRAPVLPGKTIGILGSGQLGRMLTMVAHRLGYRVTVYSPVRNSPAGQIANQEYCSSYTDTQALAAFAKSVDVITLEFENIPLASVQYLEKYKPVFPQPYVLETTQNRIKEKNFVNELGIHTVKYAPVHQTLDLEKAAESVGFPMVLKTADFGYDGKGQLLVQDMTALENAYSQFCLQGYKACIAEEWLELEKEVSVIVARQESGAVAMYPVSENQHQNHILYLTTVPAALPNHLEEKAAQIALQVVNAFKLQGLLCIEFFVTRSGELLLNEIAPRPHNSGHYTIEATGCSQFEQQLRAVCNLPLGNTEMKQPGAAMVNLLGDAWESGSPEWLSCFNQSNTFLHLYGKTDAKPGRKMGHITALGNSSAEAGQLALSARESL